MSRHTITAIQRYATPITRTLEEFLGTLPSEFPSSLSRQGEWALQELTDYVRRPSKRLRGSLAAYTYDYMRGTEWSSQALQLGAALELMQNYLLIVDDVMDQSPLRRGQPTVQVLYKTAHPDATDHEADMVAINVGLLAQHVASVLLARINESPASLAATIATVYRNIATTGLGQIDDLYEQIGRKVQASDIERKHLLKSAYYTFINPLQAGLTLAGVDDREEAALAFGAPAGTAFQAHDDYLGIFGDGEETGKANLDDIREGKYTFMVQYALAHAEPSDMALMTRLLGNAQATAADLVIIREIFTRSGAVKANQILEREAAENAKTAALAAAIWPKDFAATLVDLVAYAIERTT